MRQDQQKEQAIERADQPVLNRILHQSDFPNRIVKQRHLEAWIVFSGLAANRPDGSSEVKAYFATDTGVLSMWNGSAWLDVTLS